ncbi:hypothetical protein [Achromobacter xylosoxidans]|uniref:Uncharacterized protein n=1 Tax=Alcaligenes xylosoxydans xylosoxydans TaxID=85698 RepID=A0A1R1JV47_ALCXX|nr:hypothetical protein [Achromobacter xylosoxidans]OMG87986.1 hypothetical protein BIZ92_10335 [Achromobacter xylosoxidans]
MAREFTREQVLAAAAKLGQAVRDVEVLMRNRALCIAILNSAEAPANRAVRLRPKHDWRARAAGDAD